MNAFIKFVKNYREPFNGLNILENFLLAQGWTYKYPAAHNRNWRKGETVNTLEWALAVEGVSVEAWGSLKATVDSALTAVDG